MTDVFSQVLLQATPKAEPEDGDYYEDGLLICGKCHTPREMRLNAPETGLHDRVVSCSCECREAAYRAEIAAKKAQDERDMLAAYIKQTVEAGIADPFPEFTFEQNDAPDSKAAKVARAYAERFAERAYPENTGLMLYGPPGTGKTFLAGCIANALNAQGSHVLYTTIRKLTTAINRNFGEDANAIQRDIQRCSLLVLDDFGVERDTEYSWEQTERIINWRYEAGRPLLITTNLSPQEMQGGDITRQRVFDRVQEMCVAVPVKGESRRKQRAAQKMQQAREWLLGG